MKKTTDWLKKRLVEEMEGLKGGSSCSWKNEKSATEYNDVDSETNKEEGESETEKANKKESKNNKKENSLVRWNALGANNNNNNNNFSIRSIHSDMNQQ